MSKLMTGSICVNDLIEQLKAGHKAFSKAQNGKTYVAFAQWINDEKDKFGNNSSLSLIKGKDEPAIYIGNAKFAEQKGPEAPKNEDIEMLTGDLPF